MATACHITWTWTVSRLHQLHRRKDTETGQELTIYSVLACMWLKIAIIILINGTGRTGSVQASSATSEEGYGDWPGADYLLSPSMYVAKNSNNYSDKWY